VNGALGS
jgi:hypothetical protein